MRNQDECCIKGCNEPVRSQYLCTHHYYQLNRYQHPIADELRHFRHGNRRDSSRTYNSWISMKKRCTDPKVAGFSNYGGRGITICDRWINSFINFHADMGECPPRHTIERIDNDGNYEPSNCRWATMIEQSQNKRNIRLTEQLVIELRKQFKLGVTFAEMVQKTGIPKNTIYQAVVGKSWRYLNEPSPEQS